MSEKVSKIISVVATSLLVVIILFAAVVSFLFYNAKSNKDIPSAFGCTAFAIQTDSMEDEIKEGDFILGKKCDPALLEVDDIITFYTVDSNGKVFVNTHRIVDIEETSTGRVFTTKGDNSPDIDPRRVYEGDIISQYNGFRIPLLGDFLTFLSGQVGFFLCIVLPVLLYTIWEVYKLIKVVAHNQKVQLIKDVNEETSDAVKEAIIAEYLAKQQEEKEQQDQSDQEEK